MIPQGLESEYLILDSRDELLARGILKSDPNDEMWQVEVLDGKVAEVMAHKKIRLVPAMDGLLPQRARIMRHRYDNIIVKKMPALDGEKRQNLRIPTQFASFMYPIDGGWRGRRSLRAKDLSCGGIAFYSRDILEIGEVVEVVVPITTQPVLLRAEILRRNPDVEKAMMMHAAKFVDMCHDEEILVREAVFNVQLTSQPR